jgi:hypothetical protein
MTTALQRTLASGLLPAVLISWSPPARADAAGDSVLAKVDAAQAKAKAHYFEYDIVAQDPGKPERKLGMIARHKGEKRLFEFVATADVKGTKVLVLSPSQMYVYLPAFNKVRRIASHISDQGFFGLTYTADDLSRSGYSATHTAKITSETPGDWKLTATPKEGQSSSYAKMELVVTKSTSVITEARYFNASGVHVKTETRTGYTCEGDVCAPSESKMIDHANGGKSTRMIRKQWKLNEPIPDELFTKKSLEPPTP